MLNIRFIDFLLLTKSSSKEEVPFFGLSFISSSLKSLLNLDECWLDFDPFLFLPLDLKFQLGPFWCWACYICLHR